MFTFLQPIWLFATAGIIIPIAIHLWNVRQGKILKVGSVSLLTEQALKNSSNLKLHDLLLLLLRCLLIILVAAMLAKPQWLPANSAKEKGWLLIPKEDFKNTYTHFKPQVDSLLQNGYTLHYFDAGFEEKNINEAIKEQNDSAVKKQSSYWGTIKQLNNQVDTPLPLILLSNNKLAGFAGNRPTVSLKLHWLTYNSDDSTNTSLVEAYKTFNDSIRLITATSKSTGTFNTSADASQTGLSTLGYTTQQTSSGITVKHNDDIGILLDTSSITICIYTGSYPNDALYLKAAVDAVRQFTKRNIKLSITDNTSSIPTGLDWLFWLSDKPLPASISAKNVFKYETGKANNTETWLTDGFFDINNQSITVNKYIPVAQNNTEKTIWQNGYGKPLLSVVEGTTNVYQFYSRINPSWNGLPWSSNFPQLMLNLLINDDSTVQPKDNRMIDAKQLQPYLVKERGGSKKIMQPVGDITNFIWLVTAIIFLLERIVVHNNKKEVLNAE